MSREMTGYEKISQMMPADSKWEAVYCHSKDSDQYFGGKAWHMYPLECWALVEIGQGETARSLIVGMALQDRGL